MMKLFLNFELLVGNLRTSLLTLRSCDGRLSLLFSVSGVVNCHPTAVYCPRPLIALKSMAFTTSQLTDRYVFFFNILSFRRKTAFLHVFVSAAFRCENRIKRDMVQCNIVQIQI